jgi:chromosome segregation ATPase
MSTVAVTQIPAPRFNVDWTPVRDTLAALRAGHESLDLFVGQLFSGLESMRERLDQHDRRIKEERKQLAADRKRLNDEQAELATKRSNPGDGGAVEAGGRLAELEQERATLEDELETVRKRCEELAEALAEQKRHNAEERAEWTAEFRQLRKIVDKQAQPGSGERHRASPAAAAAASAKDAAANERAKGDPVLGSVVSQFQLLQKDAARRRQAKNKAS